jgi:hypothetical protein
MFNSQEHKMELMFGYMKEIIQMLKNLELFKKNYIDIELE